MMDFLDTARRFLWALVELGFIALLAIILVYLILGQSSGVFVLSVAQNVMNFAKEVPTPTLIGFAILIALVYAVAQRVNSR